MTNTSKRRATSRETRLAGAICVMLLLLGAISTLTGCGGGVGNPTVPIIPLTLTGNWQFTLAPPSDGSFFGGPQGGFLVQSGGSVTGNTNYAVALSQLLIPCSSGVAAVTGTISDRAVSLTAVAGTQTFTLAGTLSLNSSTMSGTYTSTAGTAGDGAPCGTAQTGLQWSAVLVPPLSGGLQGSYHSAGGNAGLGQQEFVLTGGLTQAPNTGAASAALNGSVSFINSVTGFSDYPCLSNATLTGQISGNVVTLQVIASDGTQSGLIGKPIGDLGASGVNLVTFDSVNGGYILHGIGPSYLTATSACPGTLQSTTTAGDFGNICMALSGATGCSQPLTFTPSALIFAPQVVNSPPTMQIITLTNASGQLQSVSLNLSNSDGVPNFTEIDDCGVNGMPSMGQPFNLIAAQECEVTISFVPLETCSVGTPPDQCPSPLEATLSVIDPANQIIFSAPISGTGIAAGASQVSKMSKLGGVGADKFEANLSLVEDVEHHAEIH